MDLGLAGRAYVLTGASRGLGFATARCLVDDGARVVISSRDQDRVDAAVKALSEGGNDDRVAGLAGDLGAASTAQALVDTALERFGQLDGALLSVGGPPPGRPLAMTEEQWIGSFETIFLGALRALRVIVPALGRGGAIGLVLSSSARAPVPNLGISNGLRPGLAGVVKDLADELGPAGIRIVSLLPHRVYTERNKELFAATGDAEAARAKAEAAIPLRRLGEPEEFGRVAAFVLSPAASYLTGIAVPVDGGATRAI